MPSRINMGPDGGPYIAINENNGNIELEDNTGTTVAIWDDANSQWDFQNNPISNVDSLTSNSLNTGQGNIKIQSGSVLWAKEYDGADADARLDNAIADAVDGQEIRLENAKYDSQRTVSKQLKLIGPGHPESGNAADFTADLTISGRVVVDNIQMSSTLTVTNNLALCRSIGLFNQSISVEANQVTLLNIITGSVNFASGTAGGVIDASVGVSVTDNGSNSVGDIS